MSHSAEDAFRNLVAAARADRQIVAAEQKVLNAHIVKLGLDPARARAIQADVESDAVPRIRIPEDREERKAAFHSLLKVAAADGMMSPGELAAVRAFAERLDIGPDVLNKLIGAALKGSTSSLDATLAALPAPEGKSGSVSIDFKPVPEKTRFLDHIRSMPFVARLAPAVRSCRNCSLAFANQDSYARLCRPCRVNLGIAAWSGSKVETLAGLLFIILLLPAGYLVEQATGLWSWGWEMDMGRPSYGYRSRRHGWIYMLPGLALTMITAWFAAWGLEALIMTLLGRRRTTTSD